MRFAILTLISVSLGQAAVLPRDEPVPEGIKKFAKDIARFKSCFLERSWGDFKHTHCGNDKDTSLVSCICRNQDKLSHNFRVNANICMGGTQYSKVMREIYDDVNSLGLSALCDAYEGGRWDSPGGGHGGNGGYKPEPKPY